MNDNEIHTRENQCQIFLGYGMRDAESCKRIVSRWQRRQAMARSL